MTEAGNVTSILGMPFVLPHYPDKRGPSVSFMAKLTTKGGISVEVTGTRVVLGLILHRQIASDSTFIRRHAAWVISEPETGCLVATGSTRQEALNALAERVAHLGGEIAFMQAMKRGIQMVKNEENNRDASLKHPAIDARKPAGDSD